MLSRKCSSRSSRAGERKRETGMFRSATQQYDVMQWMHSHLCKVYFREGKEFNAKQFSRIHYTFFPLPLPHSHAHIFFGSFRRSVNEFFFSLHIFLRSFLFPNIFICLFAPFFVSGNWCWELYRWWRRQLQFYTKLWVCVCVCNAWILLSMKLITFSLWQQQNRERESEKNDWNTKLATHNSIKCIHLPMWRWQHCLSAVHSIYKCHRSMWREGGWRGDSEGRLKRSTKQTVLCIRFQVR